MKYKLEPTELNYENAVYGSTPIVMPRSNSSRNSFTPALIDSSGNGYHGFLQSGVDPAVGEPFNFHLTSSNPSDDVS